MTKDWDFLPKELKGFRKDLLHAGRNVHEFWRGIGDRIIEERPELRKSKEENSVLSRQLKSTQDKHDTAVAEHAAEKQRLTGQLEAAHQRAQTATSEKDEAHKAREESEKRREAAEAQNAGMKILTAIVRNQRNKAKADLNASQTQVQAHAKKIGQSQKKRDALSEKLTYVQSAAGRAVDSHTPGGILSLRHSQNIGDLRRVARRGTTQQFKGLFIANINTCDQ